jgi:glycosyltransferase involved in cell wall biosynthesis
VIPTWDGSRDGKLIKLLSQISKQKFTEFEIIIIKGDSRQGRAINIGAALAQGHYLMTLDDDTALPDSMTFSKLKTALQENPDVGIAGGNNIVPLDAKPFVRRVMQEIPRRSWKIVSEITDSDLAEHPCLMMRREEFKALGGENELIPRGLDPYLRQVYRDSNKRVVIVPGVIYHHLPPENFLKLLHQFHRNGRQASFTNRHYPHWIIETPAMHGSFKPRRSPVYRALRFPLRLMQALVTRKPLWFFCELAYAFGFIQERIRPGSMPMLPNGG